MEQNGYNLARAWFDFRFENPKRVRAIHTELFLYIVDCWNRYGHPENFGLPTFRTMELLNISQRRTFYRILGDLEYWGFIETVTHSKNQKLARVIRLRGCALNAQADPNACAANAQAAPGACAINAQADTQKGRACAINAQAACALNAHLRKPESTAEQGGGVKNTHAQTKTKTVEDRAAEFYNRVAEHGSGKYPRAMLRAFYDYWTEMNPRGKKMKFEKQKTFDVAKRLRTWYNREPGGRQNDNGTDETAPGSDLRGKTM